MTDNFTSTFSGSLKEIIQSKHFKNRSNVIHTLFKEIISIIENVFSDELSIIKLSYTGDYIAFYRMDGPQKRIFLTLKAKRDRATKQEIFHASVKVSDEIRRNKFDLKKRTKKNRIPWGEFSFGTIDEFESKINAIRYSFKMCIKT